MEAPFKTPPGMGEIPPYAPMKSNRKNANDVKGTPGTESTGSVSSGKSSSGQGKIGREPITGPGSVPRQAEHASATPGRGSGDHATDPSPTPPASMADMSAAPLPASVTAAEAASLPVVSSEAQVPAAPSLLTFAAVASAATQPLPGSPPAEAPHSAHMYSVKSTKGGDLRSLNIFKADRELYQVLGPYTKFDHGRDKSLTITVSCVSQAQRLLKLTSLLGEPISVVPHASTLQSVGLITSRLLSQMSDQDILDGLSNQKVVKVIRKAGNTYRLTFCQPRPPTELTLCAGTVISVRRAFPLPIRCFHCQHYGHSHTSCRSTSEVCARCGQPAGTDHDPKSCALPEQCFHCKSAHQASSPTCPRYVAEKRILLLHHRDGIPFPDARRRVFEAVPQTAPATPPSRPPQVQEPPIAATPGTSQSSPTPLPHQPSATPAPRPMSASPASRKRVKSSPEGNTGKRSRTRKSPQSSPPHTAQPQALLQSPLHPPPKAVNSPLPTTNRYEVLHNLQAPDVHVSQAPIPPTPSPSRPSSSSPATPSKQPTKARSKPPPPRPSPHGRSTKGPVPSSTGPSGPHQPRPPSSRGTSPSASLSSIPVIGSASPRPGPHAS